MEFKMKGSSGPVLVLKSDLKESDHISKTLHGRLWAVGGGVWGAGENTIGWRG